MSYVNKNIQSKINKGDACGAGMKKAGLVYGSDWARLNSKHGSLIRSRIPHNVTFTLQGAMSCCGQKATSNVNPSQGAYRNFRTAFR